MPTIIQQPAVADTQVSQLQAVAEPVAVKSSGLSNFILGMIPVAGEFIEKNRKDNAQKNVALGMNDELNNFVRDVSFLDRKYYDQGREIQAVESFSAERNQTYQSKLLELARANPNMTADELLQKYEGMNQMDIEVLSEANIDSDIKEKLYESRIKQHAAQAKSVVETVKQVGDEVERSTRSQRSSTLVNNLLSDSNSAEQNALHISSYYTGAVALHIRRGEEPRKAEELARKEVETIMVSAAQVVNQNIDVDPSNTKLLNSLQSLVNYGITTGDFDIETSTNVGAVLNTAQTKILSINAANLDAQYIDRDASVTAGKTEYTYEALNSDLQALAKQRDAGAITQSQYVTTATRYTNLFERSEKARLSVNPPEQSLVELDVPLTEAMTNYGMTETEYTNMWRDEYVKRYAGDPIAAAIGMIDKSRSGREDLVGLRKTGAETFWRQFQLRQTEAEFKSDPLGANKEKAFNTMRDLYNRYSESNPALAADLLSGLDDKDKVAIVQSFQSNGTLRDAMHNTQRVVETKQQTTAYDALVGGLTPSSMGLTNWFSNGALGKSGLLNRGSSIGNLFNETGSAIKERSLAQVTDNIKAVLGNSPELATNIASLDPKAVIGVLRDKGMMIESRNGHQATFLNSKAAQALPKAVAGVPDAAKQQYVSRAIDRKRQDIVDTVKQQYGATVSVDQIHLVSSGKSSTLMVAHVIGAKGESIGAIPVKLSDLAVQAKRIYDTDVGKARGEVKTYTANGFRPAQGSGGSGVMGKIGDLYGQPAPKYNINTKGNFTRRTVQALDNAHRGQKFVVSVPNTYTVPFNGNTTLAAAWFDHSVTHEGVFLSTQGVEDKQSGKTSYNAGVQVSLNNNDPKWRSKFEAARGDAQKTINVQAEFNAEHFSGLQDAARRVGIPVATQAAYPRQHLSTQIMIADMNYHYGTGGREQAVKALTQRDAIAGRSILHNSPAYKSAHSTRKQYLDRALDNHYRNRR